MVGPLKFAGGIAAAIGVFLLATAPAQAEGEAYFDGPYLGAIGGIGFADAIGVYRFSTNGHYNSAAGDSFVLDMPQNSLGPPIGAFFGQNWQNGHRVVGFELSVQSAETRVDNATSPAFISTGDHLYDLKTHWLATLTGRAGFAVGRFFFFGHAGVALGHPVARIDDFDGVDKYIFAARAQPGVVGGVGMEVAVTHRLSLGLIYRGYALTPLQVSGPSLDRDNDAPIPGTETDHKIGVSGHQVSLRLIYRFGNSERLADWSRDDFDWSGFYVGNYAGALHQVGLQGGYNWMFGNALVGINVQAGAAFCCGLAFDTNASVRVGYLLLPSVLAFADVYAGYQTGTFFGFVDGPYYGVGAGLETPLTPHISAFMQTRIVAGDGAVDANVQGGFNFRFGDR